MQLGRIPRLRLGEYPTPLAELPNLSRVLRQRIFIKREDLLGIALGGNKVRKLEYALAEAQAQRATAIVTSGAVQSNHVRLTIACANRLGLKTYVVLRGERPERPTGNLLLDHILGAAEIHWVDPKRYATREELVRATEARAWELAEELRKQGETPYVIPNGCQPLHSALAYAGCVLELLEQMRALNLAPDVIVTACGTAGTQTGLILGSLLFAQGQIRVVGISVSGKAETLRERIRQNLEEALRFLEVDLPVPKQAVEVYDDYVGPGYAVPTPAMREAVELLARAEGILLDPVYTGKAMAGLLDLARRGAFRPGENVVFLHTGGVPALFADTQSPAFYPETSGRTKV